MKLSEFHIILSRIGALRLSLTTLACILVSFVTLTSSLATLIAQIPAQSTRPATVPAGYLITPFGYFHSSCVKHLAKGDALLKNERAIKHIDGTFDSLPVCNYSHYSVKGEVSPQTAGNDPTIIHSYIEDETVTTSSSFGKLLANWDVPPAPTSNDGQTLYFFPGMEDYSDVVSILQPVLGWNADYSGAWGIASWNCCITGTVYESSPIRVNAGDSILGTIVSTCSPGTLSCSSWNIITQDSTSGSSTTLSQSSADGQTFNWAFGGAVEVYNIVQCSDYPPNGSISFANLSLYDDNFNLISSPSWSLYTNSSVTPQCNYGGQETATNVTLSYGQTGPKWSGVGTQNNVCGRQGEEFEAEVYQNYFNSTDWQVATSVGPGGVTSTSISLSDSAGTIGSYQINSNGGTFTVGRLPVSQPSASVSINFRDYSGNCSAYISFPLSY